MAEKPSKEQRYEDLVKAVAGGELTMVKFLWKLLDRFEETVNGETASIEKIKTSVDEFITEFRKHKPKDGKTPTAAELVALIKPLIPAPIPGAPGKTPSDKKLLSLIKPLIPKAPKAIPGKPGKKGDKGDPAPMPRHEWNGTLIRFEIEPDVWGPWVNLQGAPGESMPGGGPGATPYAFRALADGFVREGITEIYFGDNITVTRTGNGVRIDAEAGGGGGGTGLDFETPTGTVDDSNLTFDVLNTPLYLVVNGAQYFEGVHYSLAGLTVTLFSPVGTGGFIRSAFGTGITVENPTGTVDDSNVTFNVANEPKYVVVNGAQYFDGAGYSYSGGTITLNSPVGTGGFIRSVY
jgi:hypothetical protein